MDVVTISRQMGSWGSVIGKLVAERMGFQLVWRDLINQAALRAGAPEVALAMIDELGLLGVNPTGQQQQDYLDAVSQVLHELADAGKVVIIGRAGQVVLRGHPRVFHVRVVADEEVRVQRIVEEKKVNPKAARAQILASDRARKLYLSRYYQVDWNDPCLYHLVINTGRISCEVAAEMICHALNRLPEQIIR
jgi:cytidylate kinase